MLSKDEEWGWGRERIPIPRAHSRHACTHAHTQACTHVRAHKHTGFYQPAMKRAPRRTSERCSTVSSWKRCTMHMHRECEEGQPESIGVYKLTCWSRIRAEVSLKFYSSRPILLDVRVQALVLVSIRAEVSLKFHSSPSRPSGRSLARD